MRAESPRAPGAPLVAVGASAGGPAALASLLQGLGVAFPAAVAIVQHVDERFVGGLADWLAQQSPLPIRLAREGDAPRAGAVVLAGGGGHLVVRPDGRFGYADEPRDAPYRPSVDVLFHSVCKHWRGPAAGVLLTGMGADGAQGLKAMRCEGRLTIAQNQATSAVYGMPKAAAAAQAASEILPLERIAGRLLRAFPPPARGTAQ